jgi:hypothetical protein
VPIAEIRRFPGRPLQKCPFMDDPPPSARRRDRYRRKLTELLSKSDDESFFHMVWAIDALRSGRAEAASRCIGYPPEAAGAKIGSQFAMHPWELETLVGQLLTTPKLTARDAALNWPTNCMQFDTGAVAVNYLRNLENEEAGLYLPSLGIWGEMHRIGQRQFPWQRGYFDAPQLYRYAYIYGQGSCAEYFERTHGLTVNDFSFIGVGLFMSFQERPWLVQPFSMEDVGVSAATMTSALRLLSTPIEDAHVETASIVEAANAKQGAPIPTAFRPSLLRQFPIISERTPSSTMRAASS